MIRYASLIAGAVTLLVMGFTSSAWAQVSPTPTVTAPATATATPTPISATATATAQARLCSTPGTAGGVPIEVVRGVVRVTPPGGGTFHWSITPPTSAEADFSVCYIEGNARVFISLECREIRRQNPGNNATANAVLDSIVASCQRIAPTSVPTSAAGTPVPTATPIRSTITPPDTGDAGLR